MPTNEERVQLRAKIDQVAQRVKTDPEFAKQIRNDPAGALSSSGLPEGVVQEIIRQDKGLQGDVAGYSFTGPDDTQCHLTDSCSGGTCWVSDLDGPGGSTPY